MLETIPHSLYRRISHINIKRAPRKHARARRSRKGSAIRKRPASYAPPASPSPTSARGSPEVEPRRAAGVTASPIVAGLSVAVERLENLRWIESRPRRAASKHPPVFLPPLAEHRAQPPASIYFFLVKYTVSGFLRNFGSQRLSN